MPRFTLRRVFFLQLAAAVLLVGLRLEHLLVVWLGFAGLSLGLKPPAKSEDMAMIGVMAAGWSSLGLTFLVWIVADAGWPARWDWSDHLFVGVGVVNAVAPWLTMWCADRNSPWSLLIVPVWMIATLVMLGTLAFNAMFSNLHFGLGG